MIYVFLADGFEEIEALAPVDIFRRAGLDVKTVGVTGEYVTGTHGMIVKADATSVDLTDRLELAVLPGGMPGADNLNQSVMVHQTLEYCANNNVRMAAICAAPLILGEAGLLCGKRAVCFPGFESHLHGADICKDAGVITDGKITTAKSAGHAVSFGLELVRQLRGDAAAAFLENSLMQL